jgi:hypothetical protein
MLSEDARGWNSEYGASTGAHVTVECIYGCVA